MDIPILKLFGTTKTSFNVHHKNDERNDFDFGDLEDEKADAALEAEMRQADRETSQYAAGPQ